MFRPERGAGKSFGAKIVRKLLWIRIFYIIFETSDSSEDGFVNFAGENLVNFSNTGKAQVYQNLPLLGARSAIRNF